MPTRLQWAEAYYRQAKSDWDLYLQMQGQSPVCHSLHFLQMASEKIAKAYRFCEPDIKAEDLFTSHKGLPKFINAYLLSPQMKDEYVGRYQQLESIRRESQKYAVEIERLAPAVDREGHPHNPEYPWESHGYVKVPIDYDFPELNLRDQSGGRRFLKLLQRVFDAFPQRIERAQTDENP